MEQNGLVLHLDNATIQASANWNVSLGQSSTTRAQRDARYPQGNLFSTAINSFFSRGVKFMKNRLYQDLSFKGTMLVLAEGMTLNTSVMLSADEQGKSRLSITQCSVDIKQFNVNIAGDGR